MPPRSCSGCATRSPRRWSASATSSSSCWSRSSPRATSSSKAFPASARRCWCARWRDARAALRARAVHARHDALRHHRPRRPRPAPRASCACVARAGLHQHPARRRDQPRAGEDADRAARGDAGVPGHARRPDARAANAVHGARDAEPGRDRRHLSAARGAARPLPVQDRDRLSVDRRRIGDRRARDHAARRGDAAAARRREARASTATRCSRCRTRRAVRVDERVIDYAVRIARATRDWPGLAAGSGLARRASRWCAPRAPRRCSTARLRHPRRRQAHRAAGAAPPRRCSRPTRSSKAGASTTLLVELLATVEAPRL